VKIFQARTYNVTDNISKQMKEHQGKVDVKSVMPQTEVQRKNTVTALWQKKTEDFITESQGSFNVLTVAGLP